MESFFIGMLIGTWFGFAMCAIMVAGSRDKDAFDEASYVQGKVTPWPHPILPEHTQQTREGLRKKQSIYTGVRDDNPSPSRSRPRLPVPQWPEGKQ